MVQMEWEYGMDETVEDKKCKNGRRFRKLPFSLRTLLNELNDNTGKLVIQGKMKFVLRDNGKTRRRKELVL